MNFRRLFKTFALRLVTVFIFALIVLFFTSVTSTSVSIISVVDRRYQHTLVHIKGERAPLQTYEVREGAIVSHADPAQCIAVNTTTRHIVLQHCTETSPETTFRLYISQDPSLKDYMETVAASGDCVDAGSVVMPAGLPVILYRCHGGSSQAVSYDSTSMLLYHTVADFNKCMDRTGVALGAEIRLVPCDLTKKLQKWDLVPFIRF